MLNFTSDQWVIVALIFVLGLLIGGFLFSGGGRKWKQRYNNEVDRRAELEKSHAAREKDWREQDSLRSAALKDRATEDRRVEDRRVEDRRIDDRPAEDHPADDRDRSDDRDPVDNRKL